ncbi:unnamed protein product, partial [Polarella glacialis]
LYDLPWTCSSTDVQAKPARVPGPWLLAGASCVAKQTKYGQCEDAYFVQERSLGVADGVGSMTRFSRHGVDCAAFAAELMSLAAEALKPEGAVGEGPPEQRTAAALARAENEVKAYGASTMTVFELGQGPNFSTTAAVANLGDSGFLLLRPSVSQDSGEVAIEVVATSREQQHSFNWPYQLARLPRSLLRRAAATSKFDTADDCDVYSVETQPGDLVLLYTDGFSDNLWREDALAIVQRAMLAQAGLPDPNALAQELVSAAQARSLDENAEVPFGETSRQHGRNHLGGKEDDITVVVAWIMPGEDTSPPLNQEA